jgi:hypothetical protein
MNLSFLLRSRASLISGLLVIALAATPQAQAQAAVPDLISGYRSITTSLNGARSALTADPAGALSRIESALNTFRGLASQLRSQQLIDGATQALNNAKLAIGRRSLPDLIAQVTQVTSVLQRALYDRYFTELSSGRTNSAVRYASTLGEALSMPQSARAGLRQATVDNNATKARSILENRVAEQMIATLRQARDTRDRAQAFQSAVRSYGSFLIVQDSPRVGDLTVGEFSGAIQALTTGDTATFRSTTTSLLDKVSAFGRRARGMAASAPSPTSPATSPAAPKPTPPATPNPAPTVQAQPPATPPAVQATPKPQPAPTAVVQPQAVAASSLSLSSESARRELIQAGVNNEQAGTLAADLASQGYTSLKAVTDALYVQLAQAQARIQDSRVSDGRADLEAARNLFNKAVQPALEVVQPALSARVAGMLDASLSGTGLRSADFGVLMGEVDAVRQAFSAQGQSGLQALMASIQPFWLNLRGLLLLVVGLTIWYPIYLLTLAFGGRNPYWRFIMIAMILLFVPPILEGFGWLGSIISQLTGLTVLDGLSVLSILHSPIAQIIWVLTLLLTVIFATMGFYGIAQQFGLIRTRQQAAPAMAAMETTAPSRTSNVRNPTEPGNQDKTVVEWDEEF